MRYVYGPLKSRRLGFSLGLSLTPHKICDFDCIYCRLGKTNDFTRERKEYIKTEEILSELQSWLQNNPQDAKNLDYLTICGSGEPTLNIGIGGVIREIKRITASAVAVITNASLFSDKEVRSSLLDAALIAPSLDTVVPEVFSKINRPYQEIKIEEIIDGLLNLRKEYRGKIWLEVMLVQGVNDDMRQIKKLKEVIDRINPDKIHLNSPAAGTDVLPVDKNKLKKIKEIIGDKCEIV